MTESLGARALMRREWASSSAEGKVALLVAAYEAFAGEAARRLRKGFRLPPFRSFSNLLGLPKSEREKRRLARVRSVFRKLVVLIDEYGFFYRDYVAWAFRAWDAPLTSKTAMRLQFKMPAPFPLPKHLLDTRLVDEYLLADSVWGIRIDDSTERERQREESEVREAERFIASLVERNPTRFPDPRAVLQDPQSFGELPVSYLRRCPEFERLVLTGYYRERWGERYHSKFVEMLSGRR